jgi:hypothetical protein
VLVLVLVLLLLLVLVVLLLLLPMRARWGRLYKLHVLFRSMVVPANISTAS